MPKDSSRWGRSSTLQNRKERDKAKTFPWDVPLTRHKPWKKPLKTGEIYYESLINFGLEIKAHRRTGWGARPEGCPNSVFWATRIFWAAREIWARPFFKEVSMFFPKK